MLPDWRDPSAHAEPEESEQKREERLSSHELSVKKFFEQRDNLAGSVRSKAAQLPPRTANRFFALAKDNALFQGCGLSLKYFQATKVQFALGPQDVRYMVPNRDAGKPGEPPLRACVRQGAMCMGTYEAVRMRLTNGEEFRPALHCAQDEGSIGLPCMFWELQKMGVRGSVTEDEWHRITNDLAAAARASGLWKFILEWGCVANFRAGPWRGASFLQTLRGAAEVFFADADESDPLFVSLYDRIAQDFGMDRDINFGTDSHMKEVFQRCKEHNVWRRKGTKMKMGRWTSWYICMEELQDGRHLLLLVLVLVGLRQGWWASLADSPLFRIAPLSATEDMPPAAQASDPERVAMPAPAAPEEPIRQSVAASNTELNREKRACHNMMHFSAMVLARPEGGRIVDMLCAASHAVRHDFWSAIQVCSTKIGALHRDINLSQGGYLDVLASAASAWSCGETLDSLGFLPVDLPRGADFSEEMEMDRTLAKHWLWWIMKIIDARIGSVGTWTHSYPHHFVGLLSDDLQVQRRAMDDAKRDFELIEMLERASLANNWVKNFVRELMWLADVFVRETFIDLLEHEWTVPLPETAAKRLRGFAYANKRTKIQEDFFKIIRKRQSMSDSGYSSRRGRWDAAVRSHLIESYDRKNLTVTPQAKNVAGKRLPPNVFENRAVSKFSLQESGLDTMKEDPPSWPSPSPENYKLRAEAWACALYCSGCSDTMRMAFLSLLASPGYVLRHPQLMKQGAAGANTCRTPQY